MLAKQTLSRARKLATADPVLVVGGGLVGLSQALFLSWQGVPTVLVERHPGSSPHPRAIGYTPRTLELFRAVGLGDQIPQAPANFRLRRARVESLAGKWFEESPWTPEPAGKDKVVPVQHSPCNGAALAQDTLEPILRKKAIELGADVRLSTELVSFEESPNGVVASLRHHDGTESKLNAAYMVAADGHSSPICRQLGIGRSGLGVMKCVRSVLFRAPLEKYLEKGVSQFSIDQDCFKAFMTTYNDGRWVLIFNDDQEHDEATTRNLVARAIGNSDIEFEIICKGNWQLSALITDSFQSATGKIFIAGDAAHTLPPTRGGYGANTGIEDAHNLAWKMAAVLSGESSPDLLSTYDAERRPIAWLRYQQMFARGDYRDAAREEDNKSPIIEDVAIELGQLYRSAAVCASDPMDSLPAAMRPDQWRGQPGTRAPHMWLNAPLLGRVSLLDALQREWVMLTSDARWVDVAAQVSERLGVAVSVQLVGVDLHPAEGATLEDFHAAFGLSGSGASLVRPDGYVGWRATEWQDSIVEDVVSVLKRVACIEG